MRLATVTIVAFSFFATSIVNAAEVSDGVLVPLFIGSNCSKSPFSPVPGTLPGAYGTVWGTELWLRNNGERVIAITVCSQLCDIAFLQPGSALQANGGFCVPSLAGQGPLILPAEFSCQLWAIELLSRQRVALPVVHASDLHRHPFLLMGIPIEENLRHTLRLYEFDGHISTRVTVRVLSIGFLPDEHVILAARTVVLTPPPRVSGNDYDLPGYAQLGNLKDLFPEIERWPPIVHVEVISEDLDRRLWAMMTITNNITGQVTIVTPDRE